jgi:hypothetical protein
VFCSTQIVALASALAERRRAEIVCSPSFIRSHHISIRIPDEGGGLELRLKSLEEATGTRLSWNEEGVLKVESVSKKVVRSNDDHDDMDGNKLGLSEVLNFCGNMFPDRKAKHAKNKLKLRRSSRPSTSSMHSIHLAENDNPLSSLSQNGAYNSQDDTYYGFGFGLCERRCSTREEPLSWLDSGLRVGDIFTSVNKMNIGQGLLSLQSASTSRVTLSILRHRPCDQSSIDQSLSAVSRGVLSMCDSVTETSTQSKTQCVESSPSSDSDSEGLSDIEDVVPKVMTSKSPPRSPSKPLNNSPVDMDSKRQNGTDEALAQLQRLFSKKLPQVVGMWMKDSPESIWEELCARRRNYDKLRLNYTSHYVTCLCSDYGHIGSVIGKVPSTTDAGAQVRDLLDKLLSYTLNVKESRRDRISGVLTGMALCGVADTQLSHVLQKTFSALKGAVSMSGVELKSLLAFAYDKYLIATDPATFPVIATPVERRCSASLIATAHLYEIEKRSVGATKSPSVSRETSDVIEPDSKRQRTSSHDLLINEPTTAVEELTSPTSAEALKDAME